ncbi:MAG: transglycosylase domain-containing protein [Bacteriovoracales bacterium]|nr:transglycosylase domain-containing protein [Bacteriovoracales bacterium]
MISRKPSINLFSFFLNILLFGVFFVALLFGILALSLPEVTEIADFNPPIPSQILSRDGKLILEFGSEKRDITPISEIPQKVIDSFLVAEDKNFYSHNGIDYWGILRAFWANIKAFKVVQGGSTITQQVAKQLYLSGERSIIRKIRDMLLAVKLEKKFTKDEILYLYLNKVYLGGGFYGVTAAFRGYFGKELNESTVAECALIAGLLVAPGRYSPYVNPEYAKLRQGYVLRRLLDTGKIDEETFQSAKNEVIKIQTKKSSSLKGGYFTEWIRQTVENKVGRENFGKNGFKIFTTIDLGLQENAEKYVKEGVKAIDKRQGYKGPLRHINRDEDIKKFFLEQREKIYRENSKFFLFNSSHDVLVKYEHILNEDTLQKIEEYDQSILKLKPSYKIYPGNLNPDEDPFINFINESEVYEAIVLHTDNVHRSIYVSIGGVKGIIPHKEFQWAKARLISTDRNYIPPVTYPNSILKRGDIILVKVLEKETSIYNTMNPSSKKALTRKETIKQYKSQKFLKLALDQESDVEGALVAIHPKTGEVLSLVGGKDFSISQFNRAIQSFRQPGSSFKPILYAVALENGFKANDILIDSPESLGGVSEGISWKPRNYDGTFKGPITFRRALETSRNIPTIKLASKVGVQKIIDFTKRIGIKARLKPDLSLALGSTEMTLMDITSTYAIFPNGGMRVTPKTIISISDRFETEYSTEDFEPYKDSKKLKEEEGEEGAEGESRSGYSNKEKNDKIDSKNIRKVDDKDSDQEINQFLVNLNDKNVYDERLAFIMTNILRGVIQNGTGASAKHISAFIGGKTGTTNNYADALFLGFSSNLVLGVWTGFDDNKTLGWGETGAKAALPIWKRYMANYLKRYGEQDFKTPNGIINVRVNKETGQLAKPSDIKTIMETFVIGTEPGSKEENTSPIQDIENDLFDEGDYFNNQ